MRLQCWLTPGCVCNSRNVNGLTRERPTGDSVAGWKTPAVSPRG